MGTAQLIVFLFEKFCEAVEADMRDGMKRKALQKRLGLGSNSIYTLLHKSRPNIRVSDFARLESVYYYDFETNTVKRK